MKELLKNKVCGSRALFTGPTKLIKGVEKSTIYGYCSRTVAVCLPKRVHSSRERKRKEKKKKKKEKKCKHKTHQLDPNPHLMYYMQDLNLHACSTMQQTQTSSNGSL